MVKSVLLLRPSGSEVFSKSAIEACGFDVVHLPLSRIEALNHSFPQNSEDNAPYDGVIVTSARAVEILAQRWKAIAEQLRDKPFFCVGEKTAEAVHRFGFEAIAAIRADGQSLQPVLATSDAVNFIYPCQIERSFKFSQGLADVGKHYQEWFIYRNQMMSPDSEHLANILSRIDIIMMYSAKTAQHFTTLIHDYGLSDILVDKTVICISSNVGLHLQHFPGLNIIIAGSKDEAALIDGLSDV